MREFQPCLTLSNLFDLPFNGALYTWTNKQLSNPTTRKLDRALIDEQWLLTFPSSHATFEAAGGSDHARCLIHLGHNISKPKPFFKYFTYLSLHPDFANAVSGSWNSELVDGTSMFRFRHKMKSLKRILKSLNKRDYQNILGRVHEAESRLLHIQNTILLSPSPDLFRLEVEYRKKWNDLKVLEEKFLCQKSMLKWLACGDSNNKFFHRSVVMRQSTNKIRYLVKDSGEKISELSDLKDHITEFYTVLLGTKNADCSPPSTDQLKLIQPFRCNSVLQSQLAGIPSFQEIKNAVFKSPNNRAPGPDGFPVDFYKSAWEVVGLDLCSAVQEFFTSRHLLREINATAITLIPKVKGADKLSDFRPISCCNSLYKIISSILNVRLNLFVSQAVQHNQSGFIKGRLLSDNVMLASELVSNFYNTSSTNVSRGCLKIDLAKAYDNVNWEFLLRILVAMEVPPVFVTWIRLCITSPTFSINLNGELVGYFRGEKGLRQGDPISSTLFVLVIDILGRMLDSSSRAGKLGLPKQCLNPRITHLSFADDLLVFFDGVESSLTEIFRVLNVFYLQSGLKINCAKTVLFLEGNNINPLQHMADSFGISHGLLPVRYLGLPLLMGKLRGQDYEPLIQSITKRLNSWQTRHLSFAGRLQLVRSVLNSIIKFWLTTFQLPQLCIQKLESLCRSFLWNGSPSNSARAKISWESICSPKSCGGLGLKRLDLWNKVFGLKTIWRIYSNKDSLWSTWVHSHLIKNKVNWMIDLRIKGSWNYRRLMKLRALASEFTSIELNSGQQALFWHDKWLPIGILSKIIPINGPVTTGVSTSASVSNAISMGNWKLPASRSPLVNQLRALLPSQPPTLNPTHPDIYLWCSRPRFNARHTWNQLSTNPPNVTWTNAVWFQYNIPRHSFMLWLVAWNRLSTRDRLRSWGIDVPSICPLCNANDESQDHILLNCVFSQVLWSKALNKPNGHGQISVGSLLNWLLNVPASKEQRLIYKLLIQAGVYEIWVERNSRIFNQKSSNPQAIAVKIQGLVRGRLATLPTFSSDGINSYCLLKVWFNEFQSATTSPLQSSTSLTQPRNLSADALT